MYISDQKREQKNKYFKYSLFAILLSRQSFCILSLDCYIKTFSFVNLLYNVIVTMYMKRNKTIHLKFFTRKVTFYWYMIYWSCQRYCVTFFDKKKRKLLVRKWLIIFEYRWWYDAYKFGWICQDIFRIPRRTEQEGCNDPSGEGAWVHIWASQGFSRFKSSHKSSANFSSQAKSDLTWFDIIQLKKWLYIFI
jgi:hypothetical protein